MIQGFVGFQRFYTLLPCGNTLFQYRMNQIKTEEKGVFFPTNARIDAIDLIDTNNQSPLATRIRPSFSICYQRLLFQVPQIRNHLIIIGH